MLEFIKKKWLHFLIIACIGIFFKFALDVTFGLIYKNYQVFQPGLYYIFAVIMSIAIVYGIRQINQNLNISFDWDKRLKERLLLQFFVNVSFALLVAVIARISINVLIFNTSFIRLMDEMIITTFVIIAVLILTLIDLSVYLVQKWRLSLAETEKFKKESIEFHFEMLRTQVNPHFLFNSLNTLSSLIYQNQDIAATFTRELAEVYRYVLANRKKDVVFLKEEFDFLKAYKYLLELRFEKKLKFEINIESGKLDKVIAPMTLQMLIENAVKHNVVSMRRPLTIKIFTDENYLIVSNNLQEKRMQQYSSEIGLKNITSRYGFITEEKVVVNKDENNFVVKIPLVDNDD